jgi:asparagine synthase (glutamine-hydrolysing)
MSHPHRLKGKIMCGITGVLNLSNREPISGERLRAGNDALVHRGPDDEGTFVEAGFGMAMRRLSIIDVAHGHQPMSNEDGTIHIVYNGEVYNHEELRRELVSLGHVFRTNADTEAILHGYEAWGRDGLLARLRGMFAFAIWDSSARTLLLARDRMGIKPLYFAEHDGRLYFSSEIRGVLIPSEMQRRANIPALEMYMRIGFVTSPHTMFEGVRHLPPAHYLWVEDGSVTQRQYWELSYEPTNWDSEANIVGEFRERLQESVDRHLMSDVPLGALLSGGVDSNTTVSFMTKTLKEPFKTVTIGFEDGTVDEAQWAAASARELGTDHHRVTFTGDSMSDYPAVMYYQEEPLAKPSHAALYYVFKACRESGLKVVMTGEGADELLGGYTWHQAGFLERALSRMPVSLRGLFGRNAGLRALGQSGRDLVRRLRGVPTGVHERYQRMLRLGAHETAYALLSTEVKSALEGGAGRSVLASWGDWMPGVKGQPEFEQLLWIQSRTRMADYVNRGLDRMSMAHSIEARPPFLDHTLWEFCASIPTGFKLRNSTEKYLLREAGRGVVPEPARVRPKAPLRVPFQRWVARDRLPDWAESALDETQIRRTGLFDAAAVQTLRRGVQAGDLRGATLLSGVLNMQAWAQMFLESPLANQPPTR